MKYVSTMVLKLTLILISFILLAISFIQLPQVAFDMATTYPEYSHMRYPLLIGIWLTLIPFNVAIYKSFTLVDKLYKRQATQNMMTSKLNTIVKSVVSIVVLYMLGMTFLQLNHATHPGIMLFGIFVIFTCFIIISLATFIKHFMFTSQVSTE